MRNESAKFLGHQLRELRKSNKITQEALASACDISPRTISEIESGKGNPAYDIMVALIRFFRVSADVFFQSSYTSKEDEHIKELVANYQACSKEQQELLFDFIKLAATKNMMTKMNKERKAEDE